MVCISALVDDVMFAPIHQAKAMKVTHQGQHRGRSVMSTIALLKLQQKRQRADIQSALDSGADGPRFKSQSQRCQVTVLGKLFTPLCLYSQSCEIGSGVARVTAGLAESNGSLPPGL